MNADHSGIRVPIRRVRVDPTFADALREAALDSLEELSSRDLGVVITDHRSSWVRSTTVGTRNVYIKTYDYPTPADRYRGIGRTTFAAPSRAAREWAALAWFDAMGFVAPQPLLLGEARRFGFLRRAVLITEAWGTSAQEILPDLTGTEAAELAEAIRRAVRAWHAAGLRDGNLDLRNVLVRRDEGASPPRWDVAKIDSPKWRHVRAGREDDARAHADWQRLEAELGRY